MPSVTTAPSTGPAVPQVAVPISTASPGTFHNYAITGLSGYRIATGPDRIYFANNSPSGVGWISYQGQFDSSGAFTNDNGAANGITEGADGSMYFTESTGSGLGRLSPNIAGGGTGAITLWNDFGVSSIGTNNVVSDPNGVLWFTEFNNNSVVRMTTWGSLLSRTTLGAGAHPLSIAVSADGSSVWVTEYSANKIAKFNLSGTLLGEYDVTQGSAPDDIAAGVDGNMYFTEDILNGTSYLGKVTYAGSIAYQAAPYTGAMSGIAPGPDGNMWFMEFSTPAIVQYNISTGVMTPHKLPSGYGQPQGVVAGGDGQLWFIENPGSAIGSYHP